MKLFNSQRHINGVVFLIMLSFFAFLQYGCNPLNPRVGQIPSHLWKVEKVVEVDPGETTAVVEVNMLAPEINNDSKFLKAIDTMETKQLVLEALTPTENKRCFTVWIDRYTRKAEDWVERPLQVCKDAVRYTRESMNLFMRAWDIWVRPFIND